MSLLEVITKASADPKLSGSQSEFPIILNPDEIFLNLKPKVENPDADLLVTSVTGWKLSATDTQLIDLGKKFQTKLKRRLKDTNGFKKDEFLAVLRPFLEKVRESVGISVEVDDSNGGYVLVLIEKVGSFVGRDVIGLVLEACLRFEIWDLVEGLIVNGLVNHSCYLMLVTNIVAKKRSDFLCLTIKHARDLGLSELLSILRYFLCPSKDAYGSMVDVKKEWEGQALLSIEKACDKNLSSKKSSVAKAASILLMVAYDGFSTSELCLHYLLASANVDEVILSSCISKLNGKELMKLVKYLGKWLKKYELFPQAVPCPEAASMLGLKACDWIPKLDDVVRWFGLVLDENFTSLMLHSEFHEELKLLAVLVDSLASEAKLCCPIANVIESLQSQAKSEQD